MTDTIICEGYETLTNEQLQTLFQTMSEVGFTNNDAMEFCTRRQVLNLFKVVRGYSALTVLKPFDRYELSGEYPNNDELMTEERCRELNRLFTKFGFTEADIASVCAKSLLREMLFLIRSQAVLTTLVHVIDCAAESWHQDFMGCRGASHTQKMEVLVWDNHPRLGRFQVRTLRPLCWERTIRYLRLFDFNEKVRDYLLEHPELIPERWKRYWKVEFDATRKYSRGFMMGRPTYSTPCLAWSNKKGEWVTYSR